MDIMYQELSDHLIAHIDKAVAKAYARPTSPWLDPEAAGGYLGMSTSYLHAMRKENIGPTFHRPTHKVVRYHVKDLDAYIINGRDGSPAAGEAPDPLPLRNGPEAAPLRNGAVEVGQ